MRTNGGKTRVVNEVKVADQVKFTGGSSLINSRGKVFRCEEAEIPYSLLEGDPKNPRYNYKLAYSDEPITADDLRADLEKEKETKRLAESIKSNGGLAEPIFVRKKNNRYIVQEGNRRLAAYNILGKDQPDNPLWKFMRGYIVPDDMSDYEFSVWLSNIHGMGKVDWDYFAKAKFYKDLVELHNADIAEIATNSGMKRQETERHIATAKAVIEYGKMTQDDKANNKFWSLYEWAKLPDEIRTDEDVKEKIFKCLKDGKFRDAKHVREVPKIVSCAPALQTLVQGDGPEAFESAKEVLAQEDPTLTRKTLSKVIAKQIQHLKNQKDDIVSALVDEDVTVATSFKALVTQIVTIARYAGKLGIIGDALPGDEQNAA